MSRAIFGNDRTNEMKFNSRLFLFLWLAGLIGVLSFLLVDLEGLIKALPLPEGHEIPVTLPVLKVLSLLQPTVLVALAVLIGTVLAAKVGLAAPFAEAWANRGDRLAALRPQIVPGIVGGFLGGVAIIITGLVSRQYLAPAMLERMSNFGDFVPLLTRILYGGITEELLLRWGVMTLLAWAGWRVFQKGKGDPSSALFVAAIVISSVLFALGHLPVAYLLYPDAPFALTVFVLVANSIFGLVAGFLYWKRGLESAIIAHAFAHLVLFAGTWLDVYF